MLTQKEMMLKTKKKRAVTEMMVMAEMMVMTKMMEKITASRSALIKMEMK